MKKRIVILGGGESGVGAALLATQKGHEVFVSDSGRLKEIYRSELQKNTIQFEEGKHSTEIIMLADEIIKSPGIPEKVEIMKEIRAVNIPVLSEIEFAARYTSGKIIGITGSNGKSTTTSLVFHMLKKAGLNVAMGGNIGYSFAREVALQERDYYVLELSSFQLDDIIDFKPYISVLLNITPDHLDRYGYSFENYINSKFRITINQDQRDYFIYCADDEVINGYLENHKINARQIPFSISKEIKEGAWADNKKLIINYHKKKLEMSINELALHGKHNLFNSMAAGIIGRILELKKEVVRESLQDFKSLEHRLELVAKVSGVEFINDSKATNVNSTWYALESMERPVIWIAGGIDKGNDYGCLQDLVSKKVKSIIALGTDNRPIHDAFSKLVDMIVNTQSMNEAVRMAYHLADKEDVVLLSPACASFDLFENYEDRGQQFKNVVREL